MTKKQIKKQAIQQALDAWYHFPLDTQDWAEKTRTRIFEIQWAATHAIERLSK